jgi:hypothetical protein
VAELERLLEVRRWALDRFGEANIAPGRPVGLLEEVLAPLYFSHRYQVDAAVKVLGGVDYRHAVRGDGQPAPSLVGAAAQRRALEVLGRALAPEQLDLSESALAAIAPRPFGHPRSREQFRGNTAPAFDALGAAATAAEMVVQAVLQPERCARVVDQRRRDAHLPGLEEVLGGLVERAFAEPPDSERLAALARVVQRVVTDGLIRLAADGRATAEVRGHAVLALAGLAERLERWRTTDDPAVEAHRRFLTREIARALDPPHPARNVELAAPEPPPGSPIGLPAATGCSWGQVSF